VEKLPIVRVIRVPLLSCFTIPQKHHFLTQVVCTAGIGVFSTPENADMEIVQFPASLIIITLTEYIVALSW
jgi:hypothetical protein